MISERHRPRTRLGSAFAQVNSGSRESGYAGRSGRRNGGGRKRERRAEELVNPNESVVETAGPASGDVASTYDAGSMGCGEGLPMEFRRRVLSVEVGEVIEIVLRDPSAKDDLPSLARMMGHRIRSMRDRDDGALVVLVERAR
jgi:TusA-related sulfurtransferase